MSTPTTLNTDISWVYSGECAIPDTNPKATALNSQVAKVGDVLLDDIFDEVTLLGRNQDGSVTIRKADGDIIDRTTGHLRCKKALYHESPDTVGGVESSECESSTAMGSVEENKKAANGSGDGNAEEVTVENVEDGGADNEELVDDKSLAAEPAGKESTVRMRAAIFGLK